MTTSYVILVSSPYPVSFPRICHNPCASMPRNISPSSRLTHADLLIVPLRLSIVFQSCMYLVLPLSYSPLSTMAVCCYTHGLQKHTQSFKVCLNGGVRYPTSLIFPTTSSPPSSVVTAISCRYIPTVTRNASFNVFYLQDTFTPLPCISSLLCRLS